ncbi:hypothetical protein PHMEG_00027323 [Phytophthora megakarya]|uniref:Uncharacterized protein n=1 Tax=Phytophthora megakarya TaxID=4795 RepID=A0A225V7G1_9STRA|nr:hypothetical protein PHMEG_00027323 [Phytophthora megakarya]
MKSTKVAIAIVIGVTYMLTLRDLEFILALGSFWSCTDFDGTDLLFPGNNQYERFRKSLRRILAQEDVVAELSRQGLKATELGTHSMRKGTTIFCSSGSTTCPSSTAVHLRAGWLLGGVQNAYLRYEAAGDMHVGHTVAGLPTESSQFSILAPHFENHEKCVKNGVQLMFPGIAERLEFVAEYCLSTPVYDYSYLKEELSPNINFNCLNELKLEMEVTILEFVQLEYSLLCEMKWLQQSLVEALSRIESTRVETVKDIIGELEARAIGAGTVTYDGLNDAIRSCLQETGEDDLVQGLTIPVQQTPDATADNQDNERMRTHFWGGQLRRVPTDFQVPDCSTRQTWILWR